jgi:hypothetical protein
VPRRKAVTRRAAPAGRNDMGLDMMRLHDRPGLPVNVRRRARFRKTPSVPAETAGTS